MNGNVVPLRFAMPALGWFTERMSREGVRPLQGDSLDEVQIAYLLYSGYWNQCLAEDVVPVLKVVDFMDWVEDNSENKEVIDDITGAVNCWLESKLVKRAIEKVKEEEVKKNSTGTTLNLSATENSGLVSGSTEGSPSGSTS